MKRVLSPREIQDRAREVAISVVALVQRFGSQPRFYGVPRGGVPALYAVLNEYNQIPIVRTSAEFTPIVVTCPEGADFIIDDLVDSGATARRYAQHSGRFFALITKGETPGYALGEWLVFPWDGSEQKSIEDSFTRLLQYIGEDPERGGLLETPARMAKAWSHWSSGYTADPVAILKAFEDGGENYDELVHVGHIPFYSQCEHHLAPFFGEVFFGYIPDKRIVGLSKMNRLVNAFSRRLQVQERLTAQIMETFCDHMKPRGAGIVVRARHLCMESRGVCHQGCVTTTSAFNGVLKEQVAARAEFFSLTNAPRL